jgi:hypothetical protein
VKVGSRRVFACVGVLLLWGGLVALQISELFGYSQIGLLGLTIVGLVIGLFVALAIGAVKRRWKPALYIGVALVICLSSIFVVQTISARQQAASMAGAEPIIAAIERYHATTGAFPRTIAELIPTYLPSMPRSSMGFNGSEYLIWTDPDGYRVEFALQGWNICAYDSRFKQWEVLD